MGSSFELGQRLSEPPGRYSTWGSQLATDGLPPLHIFDIQQSRRVADAWRKYVINYIQPDTSSHGKQPASKPDGPKAEDYQSLLARFQILEFEVKLLKEAFKAHAITKPLQPYVPQHSVFANAYENSELAKRPPTRALHPTPIAPQRSPPVQNNNQDLAISNVIASKQVSPEFARVRTGEPSDRPDPMLRARQKNQFIDSLSSGRFPVRPSGYKSPMDMSDRADQGGFTPFKYSVPQNILREATKDVGFSTERKPYEPARLNQWGAEPEESLAQDIPAGQSAETTSLNTTPKEQTVVSETTSQLSPLVSAADHASKSLLDIEPEAEIARFPTIFQLEKEGLQIVKPKSGDAADAMESSSSLTRANTVPSSNPAARLLKPFDPATEAFGLRQSPLLRRSDTERHRRRPYAERFSGSGRTLWEEFERSEPQMESTTPRPFSKPAPGPGPLGATHRSPSLSQSVNHRITLHRELLHHLATTRSGFDLSETARNQDDAVTPDNAGHLLPSNISTADLAEPLTTDENRRRARRIETCIRTLQDMGFKPHSRLPVYAEACDGIISKAMTMADEDDRATQNTKTSERVAKIQSCVLQLRDMGYATEYREEDLRNFATVARGDVGLAVENIETPASTNLQAWRGRLRVSRLQARDPSGEMPGSFP